VVRGGGVCQNWENASEGGVGNSEIGEMLLTL